MLGRRSGSIFCGGRRLRWRVGRGGFGSICLSVVVRLYVLERLEGIWDDGGEMEEWGVFVFFRLNLEDM